MAHDFITNKILEDTADAIRYCEDSVAQIAPKNFAARIRELKYPKPTWLYFTMPEGGTVTLTKNGTPTAVELEYSLDKGNTWTIWEEDTDGNRTLQLSAGQTMYVRNTSENGTHFSTRLDAYYTFGFSDWCYAGGDVASLARKTPDEDVYYDSYVLCGIFKNASKLLTPPLVTIKENGSRMLEMMFDGCENMLYAPALRLSSTTYGQYVFRNCKTIKEGAEISNNSETLATNGLFSAYYGCTSLEKVELPFTKIEFQGLCQCFYGCSSLKEIKTPQMTDISSRKALNYWVDGVAATGDFYCPAELTIPTGTNGIPSGWTRHDI